MAWKNMGNWGYNHAYRGVITPVVNGIGANLVGKHHETSPKGK